MKKDERESDDSGENHQIYFLLFLYPLDVRTVRDILTCTIHSPINFHPRLFSFGVSVI